MRSTLLFAASLALGGCSVVSPDPVWELAKAGAGLASLAIAAAPSRSSDTVRHFNGSIDAVCIQFNRDSQVPDMLPALQAELRLHSVDSRIYDGPMPARSCGVWLRYEAQIDWDQPPFSGQYRLFVRQATLSLRSAGGELLSSSHYRLDSGFASGKWTSTREKMAPVVAALLSGMDNQVTPASTFQKKQEPT